LVKYIRATPTMSRFPRRYGAYELNQCKLKTRAYDTSRMIRAHVKRAAATALEAIFHILLSAMSL
jgi:hypothetical protein